MSHYFSSEHYPSQGGASAVAIGVLDGVHRGHAALLEATCRIAAQQHLTPVAYTFFPHPKAHLQPDAPPAQIQSLAMRLRTIERYGIQHIVVETFDDALAHLSASDFFTSILQQRLRAQAIIVGQNFRFGNQQQGDIALLKQLGKHHHCSISVATLEQENGQVTSSSHIRQLLQRGDIEQANHCLGHPYHTQGIVQHGAGRGQKLGFPTANIHPSPPILLPAGVYSCIAHYDGHAYQAVANLGIAPTFGAGKLTLEVHILDFPPQMLYHKPLETEFIYRLRSEEKFGTLTALHRQIEADISETKQRLIGHFKPHST